MTPPRRPPGLLIRADTRPGIGAGHAMRQAALAERWVATGGTVTAMVDTPSSWLRSRLEATGAEVIDGPEVDDGGLTRLVERASEPAVDWVVLDGYRFDGALQSAVAGAGPRVAVVDDHGRIGAEAPHVADVVIDPNLGPRRAGHDRRPDTSALLQGPRFALLREEFRRPPAVEEPSRSRVVVLAGGERTGAGDALADALAAALAGQPQLEVTTPGRAGSEDDLAALLSTAVLTVSAAGSTAWELAHVGMPMLLFAVAENQEPVGEALAAAGAARHVGRLDVRDPAAIDGLVAAAVDLLGDRSALDALAAAAGALVDGYGAHRVVTELRSALVDLRPVKAEDARLLWTWANEPAVRAASFRSDPIPWEDHLVWLDAKLADPASSLLVAEAEGRPWGLVRFEGVDPSGGTAEIGVSVDVDARGGGAAASLIRAGVRHLFRTGAASAVLARVKPDNVPSLRAFRSADFEVVADAQGAAVHLRYPRGRDGRR